MQPAPTETSPNRSNPNSPANPETEAQHGILPPADSAIATANADLNFRPEREVVGTPKQDHGLNAEDERWKRISEYENALAPPSPRKENEGPAFKVVKKKGTNTSSIDGPQLDSFPNGMI